MKRSEKSVQELWLLKSPTFSSVNGYSVTVMSIAFFPHSNSNLAHERVPDPLVNMVPSNIAFHSNRSHSSWISTASHLHLSACTSLWLRPVRAILYTWLTSLRGTDNLYDATLECARGKFFPVWCKIRNYRFRIFNFDAELEWCKFRALTVYIQDNLAPNTFLVAIIHTFIQLLTIIANNNCHRFLLLP